MSKLDEIYVEVKAKRDKLDKDFDKIHKQSGKVGKESGAMFSKGFTSALKKIGIAIAAVFAIRKISNFVKNSVVLAQIQARAFAKVSQAVKSTGGAAGFSALELKKMASAMQKVTGIGDENIMANVQGQLLTFTNIQGSAFERVQQAVLDVNQVIANGNLGSLSSTAIQLGKALNDPVANLGALSRSGIQFNTQQKDMIKTLAETNRLAEAQAIILGELETQYGGQAAAANKASGGVANMSASFADFQERLAAGLIPIMAKLSPIISGFFDKLIPVKSELENVTEKSAEQRIEFETLAAKYDILSKKTKRTKMENEEYQKTIKALNSKYGEYLGNINLETSSYKEVTLAINGARNAIIEKTKVMAIEAEFADKQKEIINLKREQLKLIEREGREIAILKIAKIDTNNLDKKALEHLVAIGKTQSMYGLNYTKTAAAAEDILAARMTEARLAAEIAEKQKEISDFMATYKDDLADVNEEKKKALSGAANAEILQTENEFLSLNAIERKKQLATEKEIGSVLLNGIDIKKRDGIAIGHINGLIEQTKNTTIELASNTSNVSTKLLDVKDNWKAILPNIKDAADIIENGIVNGLVDAIWEARSLADAFKNIGKQLGKMATSDILGGLISLLPGGSFFGAAKKMFGFSHGGEITNRNGQAILAGASGLDFTVPAGFPNDSFPIAVQSGEHVSVTPAGQTNNNNSNYSINVNIQASDPISFERWAKTDGRSAFNNLFQDLKDRGRE